MLETGEVMAYYGVKTFFTSVPMGPSIAIGKCKLQQDLLFSKWTSMSIPQIVSLLEFCLKNTYFLFQGKYYEQVHGTVMGSPVSPLIAKLFVEEFKVRPSALPNTPSLVAKVYRWHLHHTTGKTQSPTTQAYKLTGSTHVVHHRRPQWRWCLTFPGHSSFPRPQQHLSNHTVQETNIYWPISPLGWQSLHYS